MSTEVGEIIRSARLARHMTLEEVAEQVGVTVGALSHIESGRRLPSAKTAALIGSALGIDYATMMDALDAVHSERRRMSASHPPERSSRATGPRTSSPRAYAVRPMGELFGDELEWGEYASRFSAFAPPSPDEPTGVVDSLHAKMTSLAAYLRRTARWSGHTAERLAALDAMSDVAADAIRTLRALAEDEDPEVSREAQRLLRELRASGADES